MPPDRHHEAPAADGLRAVRRYHEADLAFSERRSPVKFVVEAATGAIVLPAEPGMARAEALTLFAPLESDWSVQAALTPALIARPEAEEAVDRWAAYHGRTNSRAWIRCTIDGVKTESAIFDPEAVMVENALRSIEFALIKRVNTDRDALAAACRRHTTIDALDPLAVGIDPFGVDVRARFGILRLEFAEGIEARTAEQAERALDWLIAGTPFGAPRPAGGADGSEGARP